MKRTKKFNPSFVWVLVHSSDDMSQPRISAHRDVYHAYNHVPNTLRDPGQWTKVDKKTVTAETTNEQGVSHWTLKKVEVAQTMSKWCLH